MSTDKVNEITWMYDQDEDHFTCGICKTVVKSEDCEGCPIYGQGFCSN